MSQVPLIGISTVPVYPSFSASPTLSFIHTLSLAFTGLFRLGTYLSFRGAQSAGVTGNMKGDGTLLGSTLVVGPGEQGIIFQHRSREFQDRVNPQDILKAVGEIRTST